MITFKQLNMNLIRMFSPAGKEIKYLAGYRTEDYPPS